jgi:signal transduction histidine kinase
MPLIAVAALGLCLAMASTVGRLFATTTLEVTGATLRLSLDVLAEELDSPEVAPVAETSDEALRQWTEERLEELWTLPGKPRVAVGLLGPTAEDASPEAALVAEGWRLLGTAHPTAPAVAVLGKPGRRRVLGAMAVGSRLLVVEYEANTLWRHERHIFWLVLATTLLATGATAVLLSRRLAAPIQRRLATLRETLEAFGRKGESPRLPVQQPGDELDTVFAAFNRMADRITELEAERRERDDEERELLAALAHDIHTPMTVIRGYGELLHERGDGIDAKTRERMAADLIAQAIYVEAMLEDLLAITRSRHRSLPLYPAPLALDDLFDRLVDTFEPVAARAGLHLLADAGGLEIEADALRLRQLLTNLLRNAVVHGRGATVIELLAHPTETGVVLSVEDDGEGIPHRVVPHLFERYERGPSSEGRGLGLAIARMLAELHGGTCRHVPTDRGTRFEVELPREPLAGSET